MMDPVTFTLRERDIDYLAEKSGEDGPYDSKSDAIRNIIDRHNDLQSQVEELETQVERLENEKRMILEQREEHSELIESIQREKSMQEREKQANILTRWKWKITGIPKDE